MLNFIISEIAIYEQVADDSRVSVHQQNHALLMAVELYCYLRDVYNLSIATSVKLVDQYHESVKQPK